MSGAVRRAKRAGAALMLAAALTECATAGTRGPVSEATLSRTGVRRLADSLVNTRQFSNAHWGILIVHPAGGDTLYSHEAGKLFVPASNQKILTTAVAFAQLGPDFRFRTIVGTTGAVRDGTLGGDLIVIGRGDPSVSTAMRTDALAPLRDLADSLAARGIRRIAGRLVEAGDAFPGPNIATGWEWDDLDAAYGAGVDELMLNEGFARIVTRGGPLAGAPAVVTTSPAASYPPVRNEAVTVDARSATIGQSQTADSTRRATRLRVVRDTTTGGVLVTGTIAAGDSSVATISLQDPAYAYLAALREAMAARGITVDSGIGRRLSDSAMIGLDTLLVVESPPLREILPILSKPSQNQIAEILFKTLGLERTGIGSPDSGRRVVERQVIAWGAAPDGFAVQDGSGLSRHNMVSPETIVRVLDAMRRDSLFAVYEASFPVAGIDGTLERRMRGTPAEGNVHAKTGTLARARSLSGYVTTRDGELLIFSMLANNFTTSVDDVTRVQDVLASALAAMEWFRR
jgi:D-alanyl-D-alanine carboxypeptidase/D-alanyl-D-alanine-endopeptidase (penicillin-binding protein 4)